MAIIETKKEKEKKLIERNRRLHITHLIIKQHEEERKKAFVSKYGYMEVEALKQGLKGTVGDKVNEMRHSLSIGKERARSRAKAVFKGR